MSKKGKLSTSIASKDRYKRYAAEQRWAKNAKRRLVRHLKKHPEDKTAVNALKANDKIRPAGPRVANARGSVKNYENDRGLLTFNNERYVGQPVDWKEELLDALNRAG